jgi:hypothetical protein
MMNDSKLTESKSRLEAERKSTSELKVSLELKEMAIS